MTPNQPNNQPNVQLPPPEPLDPKGTRPPLDLASLWWQVMLVQSFLAQERALKAAANTAANPTTNPAKESKEHHQ